jgi:hypothetical protein
VADAEFIPWLELHKLLHNTDSDRYRDRELYQRQTAGATDRQIDALVYELYELTEEEIGIVGGVEKISMFFGPLNGIVSLSKATPRSR